ncbi:MAG: zf-HC2 domain-containing protein [Actinomycetota bacterium]
MTPRPDDHVRPLLGAFVLGHLASSEEAAVRAHLDGCTSCREEASQLEPVVDLLPLVDPERLGTTAEPPREMLGAVLARIEHERATRRRERHRSITVRIAVAATLASALILTVITLWPSGPSGEVIAMTASLPGVQGEAVVHDDAGDTWVELTTSGLSAGETYAVWFEEAGTRERAPLGTFVAVDGDLYISLYSTLPRDRAAAVGVSDLDGSTVMEGTIPDLVAS